MSISIVRVSIALGVACLISYAFFEYYSGPNWLILAIGSFLILSTTLCLAIGIDLGSARTSVNSKVASGIAFFLGIIFNIGFAFFDFRAFIYIIVNGLLILILGLIINVLHKAGV